MSDNEDLNPLRCWDCNINFTNKYYLYDHLFHHIKQPQVSLTRVQLPPLKLTLKKEIGNNFEIVTSPTISPKISNLAEHEEEKSEILEPYEEKILEEEAGEEQEEHQQDEDEEANVSFSPNFAEVNIAVSPAPSDSSLSGVRIEEVVGEESECGSIPGAEPTPPPEPSPDFPKIRIKTTGLLKEPLTITEITDENHDGENGLVEEIKRGDNNGWNSTEDPLKLPGTDDILSLFNNNERAKDFGFTTSDSEFIPLDRLDDRNRGALVRIFLFSYVFLS